MVIRISDNILTSLTNKLNVIIRPNWWGRNGFTNKAWDKVLLETLNSGELEFEHYDGFHVYLNGMEIWIANFPYAYGTTKGDMYPSRTTAMLLRKKLDEWLMDNLVFKSGRYR